MPTPTDELPAPSVIALDAVLSGLEAVERRIREAEAERLVLLRRAFDIAALASTSGIVDTPIGGSAELAYRAVRAEAAAVLGMSERTVEKHMDHARRLIVQYPALFEAFAAGAVSYRHTVVVGEAGAAIGPGDDPATVERRAEYEAAVLEVAVRETPGRLQPIARRLAERFAEVSLDERHEEARKLRRVYVVDHEDGMADLVAHLPAVEARGVHRRLTEMGRRVKLARGIEVGSGSGSGVGVGVDAEDVAGSVAGAGADTGVLEQVPGADAGVREQAAGSDADDRSLDEIRADLLSDLLLSGSPAGELAGGGLGSIRAAVQVVIPVGALPTDPRSSFPERPSEAQAGWPGSRPGGPGTLHVGSDQPYLEGYGPIGSLSARALAGTAAHRDEVRVLSTTGEVLTVDRYRPTEKMRRLLGARDQHCRFPGCRVPLARCDIDHTTDAALGGETSTANLSYLCRGHHVLKHRTGWNVTQKVGGMLEWRSPSGRAYTDVPVSRVMFRRADGALGARAPGSAGICGSRDSPPGEAAASEPGGCGPGW